MKTFSLAFLESKIQSYHSVDDLEKFALEIISHPDADEAKKRLREGCSGRLFKVISEELFPLIWWMKAREIEQRAGLVIGNQNYDALVEDQNSGEARKIEIGFALDGYQVRLQNEAITTFGHASPFAEYERAGKGKLKSVVEMKPAMARFGRNIVDEDLRLIRYILANKSKKTTQKKRFSSLPLKIMSHLAIMTWTISETMHRA